VFSKEGDLLFSGSTDKSISAWYADNGERLGTYIGHNGMVTSVDVSHDTTILASGAGDGEARLWDVRSGACTRVLKHSSKVTSVAFSLGSQYLLTANDPWKGTRTSIQVYDVSAIMSGAAPEPIAQFVLPFECKVKRAAWGPLNDSIYLACDDGFVRRFTNPIQDGPDTEQMRPPAPRRMDEPDFKSPCTDMTFSYDRTRFIVTSTDQTAKLYDSYTFEVLTTIKSDRPLHSASISPDCGDKASHNEFVVCGGGVEASKAATTGGQGKFEAVFHHQVYGCHVGGEQPNKGHFGPINALLFNPSGRSFASGGEDGNVRMNHFDESYFSFKLNE